MTPRKSGVNIDLLRKITYFVCILTIGICIGALFRAEAIKTQCEYSCNQYICEEYDNDVCPIEGKINAVFQENLKNYTYEVKT